SGYCDGTRNALKQVGAALDAARGKRVVTVGPIVHNPQVVAATAKRGAHAVSCADDVPAGAVAVIRAHGVASGELEKLGSKGIEIFNGVCGNVTAIHRKIEKYGARGFQIFLCGEAGHAETAGHLSRCGSGATLLSSVADSIQATYSGKPAVLIAQTSFDKDEFAGIAEALKKRIKDLVVEETLCEWMRKAQTAAETLAKRVDVMIVVGGHGSANTIRLAERSAATGARTIHVETNDELKEADFPCAADVGITAGASTPPESVEGVLNWLRERFRAETAMEK
ncbi:MAG: 4-hydroxy-3-methylbut-2-enyl diphosphate reductase, partial [bacterium]